MSQSVEHFGRSTAVDGAGLPWVEARVEANDDWVPNYKQSRWATINGVQMEMGSEARRLLEGDGFMMRTVTKWW